MTVNLKQGDRKGRKVLGRGLAALLPDAEDSGFFMCSVDKLVPSIRQPRLSFNNDEINNLSVSIRENGVIQPLLVRRRGNSYEIIAGERRWRAAQIAGLKEVPVIFKDISDRLTLQTSLVENIQRSDLNSVEEARAYKQLIEEFSMTQEEISKNVGKDRSSISNYLRLLKLPEFVQDAIIDGTLSMGHAKVLCAIESEDLLIKTATDIIRNKISVRETDGMVNNLKINKPKIRKVTQDTDIFGSVEDSLREKFQTKVNIKGKYDRGRFVIEYFSKDDFERILDMLNR